MTLLVPASGNTVPMIANLVQADGDSVRDVIHRFNAIGLASLDPQWAGGRPSLLSVDDEESAIETATTRPTTPGKQPSTRWSIRNLADHLQRNVARLIRISRETPRCLLHRRGVTFQRATTWKECSDPDAGAKLNRIECAVNERPHRTFAFDEFLLGEGG
ncbi:helix-turn-helix domain-containing protein [Streptomyces sp. 372A]